VIKTLTNI